MTDARLPGRWLTDPTIDGLSDRAFRTFCGSLMWSNEAGTDGAVTERALRFLHPLGVNAATKTELIGAGLWQDERDGVSVVDWVERGQETAANVVSRRAAARERQQKYREKKKPTATANVTRDVGRDVGQERTETVTGQLQQREKQHEEWPTRQPGEWVEGDDGQWEKAS